MNITDIHVLEFYFIGSEIFYNLEITEGFEVPTTYTATWGQEQLKDFTNGYDNKINVSYEDFENEEGETLESYLNQLNLGYIEIQINADGSGEHDVNIHSFDFSGGKIHRDYVGKHVKTYKNEKSARKFASSFSMEVVES